MEVLLVYSGSLFLNWFSWINRIADRRKFNPNSQNKKSFKRINHFRVDFDRFFTVEVDSFWNRKINFNSN